MKSKRMDIKIKDLELIVNTLFFYSDPETYHAISFIGDSHCGGFLDDFGSNKEHRHADYERKMPGKRARFALRKAGFQIPITKEVEVEE